MSVHMHLSIHLKKTFLWSDWRRSRILRNVHIAIFHLHLLSFQRMIHLEFDLEYSRVIKFLVLLNVAGIFFLAVVTPSPLGSNT